MNGDNASIAFNSIMDFMKRFIQWITFITGDSNTWPPKSTVLDTIEEVINNIFK